MKDHAQRVIRTCKYSWLFPLTGFVLTFVVGLGLSLSNQDIRVDVQRIGLIVFATLTGIGSCYTIQAFRYFTIYRTRACFYHVVGGLLFNLFLTWMTLIGVNALYTLYHPLDLITTHLIEEFKPFVSYPSKLPVWIDTDPACGEGETDDVDDCWALIGALRSPELDIRGISTVFGNTKVEKGFQIAHQALIRFGSLNSSRLPPPIFEGSSSPGNPHWKRSQASEALATALRKEKLTLVAQGPLTNIATVLVNHPDIVGNIERIIMIGGKHPGDLFHPGKQWWFHFRDFNICKDTPATRIVLYSGVPLILIPFELATHLVITRSDLKRLELGDEAAKWLCQVSEPWLSFWENKLHKEGFHPFDVLAIGYLIRPDMFTCKISPARIGFSIFLEPWGMGRDLEVAPYIRGPQVYYCFDLNPQFKEIFIRRLLDNPPGGFPPDFR